MYFVSFLLITYYLCCKCIFFVFFFFFKQKTAYEMRISDWSSDVCSSDLSRPAKPCRLRSAATGEAEVAVDDRATDRDDLAGLSVRRPILTIVANLLVVIAGLAAILGVEVRELPDVDRPVVTVRATYPRSEEHTSELQSLMRISYAVF